MKAVNVSAVNTAADEDDPYITRDARRLLYVSNAEKHWTMMLSERRRNDQSWKWTSGSTLEGPNTEIDNRSPYLTPDNHDLYYAAKTEVPQGDPTPANYDIAKSIRLVKMTQFTASTFVQAVCTPEEEMHPWLSEDGLELYFSRKTKEGWRVFVSKRASAKAAFGEPKPVEELPAGFHNVTINRAGMTMYLQGPLENNRWGLFRCVRFDRKKPWGNPEELINVNQPEAPTGDTSPCVSADNSELYFSSDRPGGKGGKDIWMVRTDLVVTKKAK